MWGFWFLKPSASFAEQDNIQVYSTGADIRELSVPPWKLRMAMKQSRMRPCWRAWTRPRMCWMAWSQNASWENWAERFRAATRKNWEMQCRRTCEQNGIRFSEHGHEAEGRHVLQAVNGGSKSQKDHICSSTHSKLLASFVAKIHMFLMATNILLMATGRCSKWYCMLGLGIDPQARLVWIYAAFFGRKTWKRCMLMLMYVIYHTLYLYLFTLQNIYQ